jgi:hypothetical protein
MAKDDRPSFAEKLYEGVFTLSGEIMHYNNRDQLVFGAAKHASPEYRDYLGRVAEFAARYPQNDPRTWVPLVRARMDSRMDAVQDLMAADTIRMAGEGTLGVPVGGAMNMLDHWGNTPAPPVDPEQGLTEPEEPEPTDDDGGEGILGTVGGWIGNVWEATETPREFATDTALNVAMPWRPIAGMVTGEDSPLSDAPESGTPLSDLRDDVKREVAEAWKPVEEKIERTPGAAGAYAGFKGAVRNFFDAARMPQQAIVGTAANMAQDASEGDYKSMLLHGYALNPVAEALFIAAENATGTQFYREDGEEQSNWSQTTFGQTILDISGQGRGEQFGDYDDPMGLQAKQGSGFFTSEVEAEATPGTAEGDPTSISQWQVQARLNANTLVDETLVTDDNIVMPGAPWDRPNEDVSAAELNEMYKIYAKSRSVEEAEAWAETMGMTWNADKDALVYPAQGFTFGRAGAGLFFDPHTYQYNLVSGIGDFMTNITTDPLTYVPGGQIRAGMQIVKGGGKVVAKGDEAIKYAPDLWTVMSQKDVQSLIASGKRAVDIRPGSAKVVIRDRQTNEILMTAAQIDADPRPISRLVKEVGRLTAEREDGFIAVGRASQVDQAVAKAPAIRAWLDGTETETVTRNKYVEQLLGKKPDGTRRMSAAELEAQYPGSRLVLRSKEDNKVLAFADDIDASGASVKELKAAGKLRLERFDFDTTPEIDDALSSTADVAFKNPWVWDNGPGLVGLDRGQGGVWATESAMYEMQFGRLRPAVDGLAAETDAYTIYRKANGKIDPATAVALSKADTPNKVIEVLGPRLGAEIRYVNDLQRFTLGMPAYSLTASIARNTDLNRLKDWWVGHVAGQSFMPTEHADVRDVRSVVEQLQRIGRVAFTDFDENPRLTKALSDVMDVYSRSTSASQKQAAYHAYAGKADDDVLLDAEGNVLMVADDLEAEIAARMEGGAIRSKAIEDVIAEYPDAAGIGKHGTDGFLTVLAKVLAEEEGVDPNVAYAVTRAWRRGDELYRQAVAHRSGDARAVGAEEISGSFTDADLLSNTLILPDARKLRGAISEYGKALHTISESESLGKLPHAQADEARQALDQWLSWGVQRWKELALMAGGVRFPVYAAKQVLDTQTTIMLSGGASVLHRPMDWAKMILTAEIRNAMRTNKGEKLRRARAINKIGVWADSLPQPIRSIVWPGDRIRDLPSGTSIEDAVRRIIDGDPGAHDIGGTEFNFLTGGMRGGQGQDVLYGQAGRRIEPVEKASGAYGKVTGSGQLSGRYIRVHGDEIYRMSRSQIFRRVASGNYSAERTADWFMTHKDASGQTMQQIVSSMDRRLAVQLRTRKGVLDYLGERRNYLDRVTGGSDELREVVASGGKMTVKGKQVPILKGNKVTADRVVTAEYRQLVRKLDKDSTTQLPETLYESVSELGNGKNHWNRWMSALFASAGRWEDIYAREPYYREQIGRAMLDMGDLMLPHERASLAEALRRRGSPKIASQLDKMTGAGVLTRKHVEQVAVARAEKAITEVAYNAANRREWAYAGRILAPFVQAAVNGMYRWSKAAIQNPESSYRFLRAGHFLLSYDSAFISDYTMSGGERGNPFIYQDPVTNRYFFALPMANPIISEFMHLAGVDAGGAEELGSLAIPIGPINQAAPALADQLQVGAQTGRPFWKSFAIGIFPGVGPFLTAPLAVASDGTQDWEEWLLPYGVDQTQSGWEQIMKQFIPGAIPRLLDQGFPSNDRMADSGRRQATFTLWAAKEYDLNLKDPAEFAQAKEIAARMDKAFGWVQTFSTYFTPTPGRIEELYVNPENAPGHMIAVQAMGDIFSKYLDANPGDYAKAEAEMVSDYGLEIFAAITPSGANSDAAPPINSVAALLKSDPASYKRFGPVLKYLATDRAGLQDEFNPRLWQYQYGTGERTNYSLEDRLEEVRQSILDFAYFEQMRRIDAMGLKPEQITAERNAVQDALAGSGWRGFEIGTEQDRNNRAELMLQAANTPAMQGIIGRDAAADLRMYLVTRQKAIDSMEAKGMAGDLMQATTRPERSALFMLGESMALENERFAYIWWRGLRSEVEPEDPADTAALTSALREAS